MNIFRSRFFFSSILSIATLFVSINQAQSIDAFPHENHAIHTQEAFDSKRPPSGTITLLGSLAQKTIRPFVFLVSDDELIIIGIHGDIQFFNLKKKSGNSAPPLGNSQDLIQIHSVVELPKRKLLILGNGVHRARKGFFAFSKTYNLDTRELKNTAPMHFPRSFFATTRLKDRKILISGGVVNGQTTGSLEVFNPKTQKYKLLKSEIQPRAEHKTVLLSDGSVIFVGGGNEGYKFRSFYFNYTSGVPFGHLNTIEKYNPISGVVAKVGTTDSSLMETVTLLPDNKVFMTPLLGSSELYDLNTNRLSLIKDIPLCSRTYVAKGGLPPLIRPAPKTEHLLNHFRFLHTSILLDNGNILILGGGVNLPNAPDPCEVLNIYRPAQNDFQEVEVENYKPASVIQAALKVGSVVYFIQDQKLFQFKLK